MVWDDRPKREPVIAATAAVVVLFSFLFVWARYPVLGAALTVGTVASGAIALVVRLAVDRDAFDWWWMALALVLFIVAADDVLQHAFGG